MEAVSLKKAGNSEIANICLREIFKLTTSLQFLMDTRTSILGTVITSILTGIPSQGSIL